MANSIHDILAERIQTGLISCYGWRGFPSDTARWHQTRREEERRGRRGMALNREGMQHVRDPQMLLPAHPWYDLCVVNKVVK